VSGRPVQIFALRPQGRAAHSYALLQRGPVWLLLPLSRLAPRHSPVDNRNALHNDEPRRLKGTGSTHG
jgi:hypothetical protein